MANTMKGTIPQQVDNSLDKSDDSTFIEAVGLPLAMIWGLCYFVKDSVTRLINRNQ